MERLLLTATCTLAIAVGLDEIIAFDSIVSLDALVAAGAATVNIDII